LRSWQVMLISTGEGLTVIFGAPMKIAGSMFNTSAHLPSH